MTVYYDPSAPTFVKDLRNGIKRFDEQARPFLFVHTPGRGFSLEGKEEYSWISRVFSSSVYDAEATFLKFQESMSEQRHAIVRNPEMQLQGALLGERLSRLAADITKKKNGQFPDYASFLIAQSYECIKASSKATGRPAALIAVELHLYQFAVRFLKETRQYDAVVAFQDILYETALQSNELNVAIEFIARGADIRRAKELNLLNPLLHVAVELKNELVALQILQAGVVIQPLLTHVYVLFNALRQGCSLLIIQEMIRQGAPISHFPQAHPGTMPYTPLYFALGLQRYDVVAAFLEHGADPNEPDPTTRQPLIKSLIDVNQEETAMIAIQKGADVRYKDARNQSLLHHAAVRNMRRLIPLLIQKGVSPNQTDQAGETAAFGCLFITAELLIANGLDPTIRNNQGKTFVGKLNPQTPPFTLQAIQFDLATIRAANSDLTHFPSHYDRLLVCFFMQDAALTRRVASKMTQDQFEIALWKLNAAFPKCSTDTIALAPFIINKTHLKKAFDLSKIPPKPPGENLKDLLMVFDTIDFRTKYKPSQYSPEFRTTTYQELRESISKRVVKRVQERVPDAGTGRQGTALFVTFYDKLESALLHITKKVKALGNDEESMRKKASLFFELSLHTPLCCEQLSQAACNWYNYLVRGIPTTLENYALSILTGTREGVLRSLVKGRNQSNHDMHQLKYLIGRDFGIEGADFFTNPDAYRALAYGSKEEVLQDAMARYTTNDIVEAIQPQITDFQDWRDRARDYFKSHAPATWAQARYEAIRKEVLEMQKEKRDERAVKAFLATKEIFYQTGTALQAIEADRASDYYTNCVLVDPNAFKMHKYPIACMMTRFGVLDTVFTGKKRPDVLTNLGNRFLGYARSWLPW